MIRLHGVRARHGGGPAVFTGLDLYAPPGVSLAVVGAAGSGKSTLLDLLVGRLRPDSGRVEVLGLDLERLSSAGLQALRRRLGVVPQRCTLLEDLCVEDNVALALTISGLSRRRATIAATATLERLGLARLRREPPSALSVGQARRVCVARAAVRRPALLLADEPAAGLDAGEQGQVYTELAEVQRSGSALLLLSAEPPPEQLSFEFTLTLRRGALLGAPAGGRVPWARG